MAKARVSVAAVTFANAMVGSFYSRDITRLKRCCEYKKDNFVPAGHNSRNSPITRVLNQLSFVMNRLFDEGAAN